MKTSRLLAALLALLTSSAFAFEGFSPWSPQTQWYYVAAQANLPTPPGARAACAWAAAENTTHTWSGSAWVLGGACATGLSGTGGSVSIIGNTISVSASFTRPSDTTTYAAGDVVGPTGGAANQTFANVAAAGYGGMITDVVVAMSTAQSLKLEAELWLFDTAPTAVADNAAFNPSDGENDTVIARIPISSADGAIGGANYMYHVKNQNIAFHPAGSGTSIYGVLVARNAYIPTSAETFKIQLHILKD
jgi:hypothetical protein